MRWINSPLTRALAIIAVLAVPLVASAAFRSGRGSASFSASGPVGMRIEGSSREVSVADDGSRVTVRVSLRHLSTGIELRDAHMRDRYLEVGRFPNAELVVDRSVLRIPQAEPVSADARATFRMHGRERPVHFHYEARRDGTTIRVSARAAIDMGQFGIQPVTYLGMTVRPNVSISVRFSVSDQ